MACVNPDGSLTPTAKKILRALGHPLMLSELSEQVFLPLFVLRSSLRELSEYGLLQEAEEKYQLTDKGRARL